MVEVTSEEALRPFVVQITGARQPAGHRVCLRPVLRGSRAAAHAGPLIRIMGDRFAWEIKAAVLRTLGLLIAKAGAGLKPFVPQLQTTFLKCLADQARPPGAARLPTCPAPSAAAAGAATRCSAFARRRPGAPGSAGTPGAPERGGEPGRADAHEHARGQPGERPRRERLRGRAVRPRGLPDRPARPAGHLGRPPVAGRDLQGWQRATPADGRGRCLPRCRAGRTCGGPPLHGRRA